MVTINELITEVNIALDVLAPSACVRGEVDGIPGLTVNEIILGATTELGFVFGGQSVDGCVAP
jgi:hypothetical protein